MPASRAQRSPSPARVRGNRWPDLVVPSLDAFTPRASVSVVVPHYEAEGALLLTLEALAAQTYPSSLLQVLVVDDGSARRPTPPPIDGLDVQVLVQERKGFGLARARNLGASRAEGEVVVFLDCDMVPEPGLVAAHARWHHVVGDAITIGFRVHVEFDALDSEAVRRAARRGSLEPLFDRAPRHVPEYVELHMERTQDLTSADDDLFRVVTGGNMGIRKDTFAAVGGFDGSFDQWGGEDTEFGYRAYSYGCLLVPERLAHCWHQGMPGYEDPAKQRSLHEQRAKLAHLIPHRGFRRSAPGRSYRRPRLVVSIPVAGQPAEQVAEAVESVLGSQFHDLVVELDVAPDHPERRWLLRQFGEDPRVRADGGADGWAPLHMVLPPTVTVEPAGLARIVDRLEDPAKPIGLLHLTLPGTAPRDGLARAWRTRARMRADRLGDPDGEALMGELFGEEWAPGSRYGFRPVGRAARVQATPPVEPLMPVSAAADLASIQRLVRSLTPGQRRLLLWLAHRAIRLVKAADALRHARRWSQVQWSIRGMLVALLPEGVAQAVRLRLLRPYRTWRSRRSRSDVARSA